MSSKGNPSSRTQHNALTAHRRRRREQGLIRVEVRIPEVDADIVREVAAILRGEPRTAQQFRAKLLSVVNEARHETSVFDIFGSDLPDHYFESVFESGQMRR